jgi:hypothetical protein
MPAVSRSGPVSGEVAAGAGRDGAAPAVGGAAAGGAAVGLAAGGAVPPFPVQPASSRPRTRAVTTEPRRLHGNAHADPDTSPPTADIVPGGGRRDQALADDAPIRLLAISAGDGVNPRTAESVPILPQVRERLGLDADVEQFSPQELMKAILTAPVDLFCNDGIGTYMRALSQRIGGAMSRRSVCAVAVRAAGQSVVASRSR